MKKILITGAGGYIGSVATSLFLSRGFEVVGVDSYIRGFEAPLKLLQEKYTNTKMRYYPVDIRDGIKKVFDTEKNIDAIIHYAAFCNVGESEKEPQLYLGNNVSTVVALLESMRKYDVKKLVFSSTCAVYGEPQTETLDETHPLNPTHPYGESKFICERIIQWYSKLFGLEYVFMRYFNVCGATDDGSIGDSKNPSFHLMQNAIRGALGIAEFYLNNTKVNTPDETPIRDYVNVVDLNEAHVKAVEFLLNGGISSIFNLGTGTGNSVMEIISAVEKITGKKLALREGERRSGDVSKAVASNKKITDVLGWKPTHSIEDSVNSLVKWYTVHPNGWGI